MKEYKYMCDCLKENDENIHNYVLGEGEDVGDWDFSLNGVAEKKEY